jgi:hypothetical protein
LFKNKKISKNNGIECKIQQHFSLKKTNSKPKSKFEFFCVKHTNFSFFFEIVEKIEQIPEILSLQALATDTNS